MTEDQRRRVIAALTIGASRDTAAAYVGVTRRELEEALAGDEGFAAEAQKSEATAEVSHLRNIHEAIKDQKNWRASVWWLKQTHPERYDRKPENITDEQLREFIHQLLDKVSAVIPEEHHATLRDELDQLISGN